MDALACRQASLNGLGNLDGVVDGLDKDLADMAFDGTTTFDFSLGLSVDGQVSGHGHG
jgi:hypothetical protein